MEWHLLSTRGRDHAIFVIDIVYFGLKNRYDKKFYDVDLTFTNYRQFLNKREIAKKDYDEVSRRLEIWSKNEPQKILNIAQKSLGFIKKLKVMARQWKKEKAWEDDSRWIELITAFREYASRYWAGPIFYTYLFLGERIVPERIDSLANKGFPKDKLMLLIEPQEKTEMTELLDRISRGEDLTVLSDIYGHLGRYYFWGNSYTPEDLKGLKGRKIAHTTPDLKLPGRDAVFFSAVRKFALVANKADEAANLVIDVLQPMWHSIADRFDITYEQMANMQIEEVIGSIRKSRLTVPKDELKRRCKGHLFWYHDGKIILKTQDLDKYDEGKVMSGPKTLKGKNASVTRNFTGMVRIVNTPKDMKKFRKGEILVTPMTNPQFLPVMEKAKAIITDDGGMLCHAAIVAREMKKPCIVGTLNATKALKDNDMISVNAKTGVIKVIKR